MVKRIHNLTMLPSISKRETILEYLSNCDDREVTETKRILALNVPYRLQAPLLNDFTGETWHASQKVLLNKINVERGLLYYFYELNGLNTIIKIDDDWNRADIMWTNVILKLDYEFKK